MVNVKERNTEQDTIAGIDCTTTKGYHKFAEAVEEKLNESHNQLKAAEKKVGD